ncbi:MAG: YfiR family protein [Verrucomicrobia bacterium]|nr:MAG: YfiR family protein [Verrucomicrobiota bacterium]
MAFLAQFKHCLITRALVRRAWLAALSSLLLLGGILAGAQEFVAPEQTVKAAFLYNFAKFVEWPTNSFAASNSDLVIGVLGKDPFGQTLDETVAGRRVDGHPVVIARYRQIGEATNCHVLFLASSEKKNLPRILAELKTRAVLTVSDIEDFAAAGGLIQLVKRGERIQFKINAEAAGRSQLKFSSKLLRLSIPDGV